MKVVIPALGLQRNGGNRVLMAVANALAERGVECEFIVPAGLEAPGFELHSSVRITPVNGAVGNKPLRWAAFLMAAPSRLRGQRVLANHFVTALAAALARPFSETSVVYLVQDLEYRFYRWPLSWLARLACHLTFRLPELLPANPYLEQELRRRGITTRTGLALGPAPAFLRMPVQSPERTIDVLMFLRRGRHKRLDRYRSIARALHARGRSLAAIAPEAALFEELPVPLAARLVPTDDAEIIGLMDRCRTLLLASEHEGFALPPLEAMARGLPVVLFPCGGPASYAKDGVNALVVNEETVEQAIDRVERLLEDETLHRQLSDNARQTAIEFDLERAANQAAEVITELMSR